MKNTSGSSDRAPRRWALFALGMAILIADYWIASANANAVARIPITIQLSAIPLLDHRLFPVLAPAPRARIGWVLLAFAFFWSLTVLASDYAQYACRLDLPEARRRRCNR